MNDIEIEPARGSLLDPANIGRWAWLAWNGNKPHQVTIAKVSRTHVTPAHGKPHLVNPDANGTAYREGDWPSNFETDEHREARHRWTARLADANRAWAALLRNGLTIEQLDELIETITRIGAR